jgi:hypothetical protein
MGSLPSSMHRHLCCRQAGVVPLVVMVLPSLMHRHLCRPGVFAIVTITLLPLLQWHHCHHQAGVITITMALSPLLMHRHLCCLPLSQWHCHPCCASTIANIARALSHLLHGIVILIVLTSLPSHCIGIVTVVALVLMPPLSWRICAVALVLLPLSLLLLPLVRWH